MLLEALHVRIVPPIAVAPTFLGMVLSKDEMCGQRRALTLVRNRFVLSATPCRFLDFLVAKKPFFGKVEARPKGTVSFVHSIYHGPTLS
ncbi:hypothetical protein AK95_15850 [Paenibacillus sp. LC231]|nr:hypothetical protein AK95_15850 [Paenibacillus sp. LC231]